MEKFKGFYDALKENLASFRGEYESFINYGPDLYKLLVDLLGDKRVKSKQRLKIDAALAYFIAPMDVIPETIYGPHGYSDDIYICCWVIKELEKEIDKKILEEHWEGTGNFKEVVNECFKKSSEIVKGKEKEILEYVGLE
jgi:uncharacterized membrane protein YkvA (DUF1232 family)